TRVLIAVPSASRRSRKAIIDRLEPLAVRVQTIPDMDDVITGVSRLEDIRDVDVEDLLGRDPVPPHLDLLGKENSGRSVMVTGAGGSIGSELCRQLLDVEPRRIVLVERSEIALYSLDRELRHLAAERDLEVLITALLADVRDRRRMREIIDCFGVNTIYHAAAYKHVPIVEHNMFEGISNNVSGTAAVAHAAMEADIETFVLVSTDKAVSPTNVMGASKRLAELVLQAQAMESKKTRFCMVRFGNVLASSGSVVPLFREQIRSGGPVTVTHPEIIRYFMTITEAAQLVIQAGAMASGGDVFVLDMGEPVKIVDLATKMIHLMGQTVKSDLNPAGDIEIVYTGLRPAEKLYEELLIGNNVTGTKHPRIMRANEAHLEPDMMQGLMLTIERLAERRDYEGMRDLMVQYVEGYQPTGQVADHLYPQRVRKVSSTVTSLNDYQQANESKRVPD
ncbi:MAG: nucleoside-diphosphate sugar epimerase/dehydratase, partial [Pseudomonadota bacterium]